MMRRVSTVRALYYIHADNDTAFALSPPASHEVLCHKAFDRLASPASIHNLDEAIESRAGSEMSV